MGSLRDTAHISLDGKRARIREGEPLEESVRTAHAVMRRVVSNGGQPYDLEGRKGYAGHCNMTGIMRNLTVDMEPALRTRLTGLVSQVLRRTGAAHCLHRADPIHNRDPIWFVADQLPETLVIVSSHIGGRSAEAKGVAPDFKESLFLRPGEKRLRPEEVGEDLPPGEVTVTQTATTTKKGRRLNLDDEQRAAAADNARRIFADHHAENQRIHAELLENLHEFVVTAPIPMTGPEIAVLYNRDFHTEWHESTMRGILRELEEAGRISSRKETSAERLVRGGGSPVKATGPKLYGPPEGVPERTKLPRGIKPLKSAAAHADEKRRLHEALDNKVYRVMDVARAGKGHNAPRTPHMIAIAADISDREATEALERLVQAGRVFYHPESKYYAPMSRVRQSTIDRFTAQPELPGVTHDDLGEAEVHPAVKAAEAVPPAEPDVHTADRRQAVPVYANHPGNEPVAKEPVDIAALVRAEVERALGGGGTPDPSDAEQFERIQELERRNAELEVENEKLKRQVRGLRETLAAME